MVTVDYNIRTTGDTDTINNPSFIVRAIRIVNNSGDTVILDNGVDTPISVPVGTTPVFNQEHLISTFSVRTASNTVGYAVAVVYDSPQDMSTNPPLQQLPGIVSSSQAPGTTFNITPAANANFTVNPGAGSIFTINPALGATFTINGSVTITSGTVTATITSGTINVQNVPGGVISAQPASSIRSYNTLDNTTVQITLVRASLQVQIKPILPTLTRGGSLSVWATDSTTQRYDFLLNEPFQASAGYVVLIDMMHPYYFDELLPSGAVLNVQFTGAMGVLVGY